MIPTWGVVEKKKSERESPLWVLYFSFSEGIFPRARSVNGQKKPARHQKTPPKIYEKSKRWCERPHPQPFGMVY